MAPSYSDSESLTCKDTAALLGVSITKVHQLAAAGRIKVIAEPGRPLRFGRRSVEAYKADMMAELQAKLGGGDGQSPMSAFGGTFLRGLILSFGSYKLVLLWTVIERTWGPNWWTWLDPAMRRVKSRPCRLNTSSLARQYDLKREHLVREKQELISQGVLIEHPDKTLEVQRDLSLWRHFAERPELLDALKVDPGAYANAAG